MKFEEGKFYKHIDSANNTEYLCLWADDTSAFMEYNYNNPERKRRARCIKYQSLSSRYKEIKPKKCWSKWGQFYQYSMTSENKINGHIHSLYTTLEEAINLNSAGNQVQATIVQYDFEQEEDKPARIVNMRVVKEEGEDL